MKQIIKNLELLRYNFFYENGNTYYFPYMKASNKCIRSLVDNPNYGTVSGADEIEEITDESRIKVLVTTKCSGCFIDVFINEEDVQLSTFFKKFFEKEDYYKYILSNICLLEKNKSFYGTYVWFSQRHKDRAKYK